MSNKETYKEIEAIDPEIIKLLADENESLAGQGESSQIQGTDGVRGIILFKSKNPVYDLVNKRLLSPEFIEIYVYSWGRLLLEEHKKITQVIISQDPRDPKDIFLKAAISGLNKAGIKALYIGILPTPAVPFYIIKNAAMGGIMLTASHNPSTDHGIKLFDSKGLKYLPEYELRLAEIVTSLDASFIQSLSVKEEVINRFDEASKEFSDFLINKWDDFIKFNPKVKSLITKTILVADFSNGALSKFGKSIFNGLGFKDFISTSDNLSLPINHLCGVTYIEKYNKISLEEWQAQNSSWKENKAISTIFKLALKGHTNITGIVFDGDGDRFIGLDYDASQNLINITGGDFTASIIIESYKNLSGEKIMVHTIESDYLMDEKAKNNGFKSFIESVGDKWLIKKILALWPNIDSQAFIFGYETSGHFILPQKLTTTDNTSHLLVTGNGCLIALKFLANLDYIRSTKFIPEPQLTLSINFVDKSKLVKKDFKTKIQKLVKKLVEDLGLKMTIKNFNYEYDLLYYEIKDLAGQNLGRIFIRNSGTEDKASINLRSIEQHFKILADLVVNIYEILWLDLKNQDKEETALIIYILKNIPNIPNYETMLKKYPKLFPKVYKILENKEKLISNYQLTELGKRIQKILNKPNNI